MGAKVGLHPPPKRKKLSKKIDLEIKCLDKSIDRSFHIIGWTNRTLPGQVLPALNRAMLRRL